jgi:hypothetical protein
MPKIYKTMQGESIDIEALFRKHELAQAVGNIRTNARGDELGPGGIIVKTREQKAREYYQRQKAANKAADAAQSAQRIMPSIEDTVPLPELNAAAAPKEIKIEQPKGNKKPIRQLDDPEGELEK